MQPAGKLSHIYDTPENAEIQRQHFSLCALVILSGVQTKYLPSRTQSCFCIYRAIKRVLDPFL